MVRVPLAALVLVLAGCAGAGPGSDETPDEETYTISGIVVSQTIVPVEGAAVRLADAGEGGPNASTDEDGRFQLGPVPLGTHRLAVSARGFADTTVEVVVTGPDDELLKVVLTAVAADVPYATNQYFQGYLDCTIDTWVAPYQIIGAPCLGVVDLVTGTNISRDTWQFVWDVAATGFAGILIEMVWDAQPTGDRMGLLLRNVAGAGSGVDAGGTNIDTQYYSTRGPSPMRAFVQQGIENPGADDGAVFQEDPDEVGMQYKILILGRADYSQPADVHLMLQYEPEIFLTQFFHAMGDESYSLLG